MRHLKLQLALASSLSLFTPHSALAEDLMDCTVQVKTLICSVTLEDFILTTASLMTNGWENQIDIRFELIDNNQDIIKTSRLHASQRCYIDPFESPCLVLWRGAKTWKTYKDDRAFLRSISSLTVHAMKFKELIADNYKVRMTITVQSGSERETESVKQIFKQTGNDLRLGESSLVGSFISAYTPNQTSAKLYTTVLETPQFYIDLDFTGIPEAPVYQENEQTNYPNYNQSPTTENYNSVNPNNSEQYSSYTNTHSQSSVSPTPNLNRSSETSTAP